MIHTLNRLCWGLAFTRKFVGVLALLAAGLTPLSGDVLIPSGAEWRFFMGTREASSPMSAWRARDFSDGNWQSGAAPIGYGEPDIVTSIPSSQNGGWSSVYFRRGFHLSNPAGITQADLTVRIDDGFVAWINGTEVARHNVPGGQLAYSTYALSANEPVTVTVTLTNNLTQLFLSGANVLAIHGFNGNVTSSDFLLDAQLVTTSDTTPPHVVEMLPPAGATVRALRQLEIYFNENVSGVEAGNLLINGIQASGVQSISPRDYIFNFAEPPTGVVQVAWTGAERIQDWATPPNPFAGGSWSYTLDPAATNPVVVISEFMAENTAGIRDEDGNRSDWIELHNLSAEVVNLEGWSLTDDASNLSKWRFPKWNLNPNAYLLVWASEKNRAHPGAELHTNFKLATDGEHLALIDPQGRIVSEFAPAYPPQQPNISYGRDRVDPGLTGFFSEATPGKPNVTTGSGFAPEPVFSIPGGTYTDGTLHVALSASAGVIRYTVDGSAPTASSPVYSGPLVMTVSTVVQARVFQPGLLPSPIAIQTYTLLGSGVSQFTSNLPVLIINTSGRNIPQDQRIPAFISAFEPQEGRTRLASQPDFQSAAQIEVRGQTSSGFPKQPYNLEINDAYGNDLEVPLLGLPAESDWVLHNPYSDKCLMNNVLAFDLHRAMGHYAPRCRFVEVFVQTGRDVLNYPANYRGVYVLMEKIKVDRNRVAIAPLTPTQNQEPEVTGGYVIKKDKDSPGDLAFFTQGGGGFGGQFLKFHEPKPREITGPQRDWIVNYVNQFERSLYAADWLSRTGTNHYSHYIDLDSFVDNHWIVEFSKQIDGYRLSNYMSKDRGGKLRMDPIWDWNLAFGNADYLEGWNTNGWYYPQLGDVDHIWLRRLISGTRNGYDKAGDPDFNQRIIDRWSVLRTNILAPQNVEARIDEIAATLNEAQVRDFTKYPRLNTYVWPNPSFYIAPTYGHIIEAMKRWVRGRYAWIDSQFLKAPQLSQAAGPVNPGSVLSISAPAGSLLFTIDGTDPRLPGGAVSPLARSYIGQPLPLDRNMRVLARARNGTNWSGPAAATFIVETPPLVVTEMMSSPAGPALSDTNSVEDFEFIELKNIGAMDLNLPGFQFTRGIDYTFTAASGVTRLAPGEHVVLVKDRAAFAARYPEAVSRVAGEFGGNLDNAGERLTLEGPLLEPVLDFTYGGDWFPITRGHGFSMVIADERAPRESWGSASSWRVSSRLGGSPGTDDPPPPTIPRVLVNEVVSHPVPPQVDAIELYNPGNTPADISGWFLTDNFGQPGKYVIPAGTVVVPGGFLVIDRTAFGEEVGGTGFGLSSSGEAAYLFSGDGMGLTGYVHGFPFGAAAAGVSFGRHVTSLGEEHFVAQAQTTLGGANAGPRTGPVVINEIMFNPPSIATNNNTIDEYIELLNVSGQPLSFADPVAPTNRWRLSDGVTFELPSELVLPPGGLALLVNFDPADSTALAAFRSRYGVDPVVPILGRFGGNLNNAGERLRLSRPVPAATTGPTTEPVSYILVDEVLYSPNPPWPEGASGTGNSLQRLNPNAYGNDPINWRAGPATAGQPNPGAAADSDEDGLPDAWELLYFGNLAAGPDEDPDGDGMTNLQEYLAGTDPTDQSSLLAFTGLEVIAGALHVTFDAVAGRSYSMRAAEQVEGPWETIQEVPAAATGGEVAVILENENPPRFYRLSVNPL